MSCYSYCAMHCYFLVMVILTMKFNNDGGDFL